MTKPGYDHIEMLLDRSGSMETIKADMEGGIRSFIEEQRAVPGRHATFALRQFDTEYETAIPPTPIENVVTRRIVLEPRGGTALWDAMGRSITECGQWLAAMPDDERPETVTMVIVTDGAENSSREWALPAVNKLVGDQQDQWHWMFLYLGANQDAVLVGQGLGIAAGNSVTYDPDAEGVAMAYAGASAATTRSRTGR